MTFRRGFDTIAMECSPFTRKTLSEDREMIRVTGYIEKDPETGLYVAIVPGIPGAHTQAETLDELQKNLREVVELCLEEMDEEARKHVPEFVGILQLEVAG